MAFTWDHATFNTNLTSEHYSLADARSAIRVLGSEAERMDRTFRESNTVLVSLLEAIRRDVTTQITLLNNQLASLSRRLDHLEHTIQSCKPPRRDVHD